MYCEKVRYGSKEFANKYIRRHNLRGRLYYCNKCNGWHLTTMPRDAYRAIMKGKKKR